MTLTNAQLPTAITFSSYEDYSIYVARLLASFQINESMTRIQTTIRFESICNMPIVELVDETGAYLTQNFTYYIKQSLNAIQYAVNTGRLHGVAQEMINNLSGYDFAKLIIKLSIAKLSIQETVYYLNGKQSLQLPIASD